MPNARHRSHRTFSVVARAILSVAVALGCRAPAVETPSAEPARPLAGYAGRLVVVLPVQSLDDGAGWGGSAAGGGVPGLRDRMDDELAFALSERGLTARWILPAALAAMTRRGGTYLPDLRALTVEQLRRQKEIPDNRVTDPLASQLRSLIAFTDARWVLLPVEARLERVGAGPAARVTLQMALIDARGASVAWMGEVTGDSTSRTGAPAFASVAARAADLISPGT